MGRVPMSAGLPDLRTSRFGEADAPERWVHVEGVGRGCGRRRGGLVVEQVGGDDLEVVVGGVGEGALAVAVAQGPDAGDAGAELVVDVDVAVLVDGDAGFVEAQVVGVGAAADGEKHVGAVLSGVRPRAVDAD